MQNILKCMACSPMAFAETPLPMQPIAKDGYLEDEHLIAAWQWMKFSLKLPDDIHLLDPALVGKLTAFQVSQDHDTWQELQASIVSYYASAGVLLCPISGRNPAHWTLLVRDGKQWRYYDTMSECHKNCKQKAKALIALFDSKEEIALETSNVICQKSADCGYYVLAYMEQEASTSREGPASRGWPADLQKAWQTRLP